MGGDGGGGRGSVAAKKSLGFLVEDDLIQAYGRRRGEGGRGEG